MTLDQSMPSGAPHERQNTEPSAARIPRPTTIHFLSRVASLGVPENNHRSQVVKK